MSAKNKARVVWIFPVALLASWLVVRSLAASPDLSSATTFASGSEVKDASLRKLIGGFADAARSRQPGIAR